MARYLLTGGTGFIGTALSNQLLSEGHSLVLLTRRPQRHENRFPREAVRLITSLDDIDSGERLDGIVNLAGQGIADKRWTGKRKQELLDSRLRVTGEVVDLVRRLDRKPPVMVSGSAVGWYGAQGDKPLDERSEPVEEFTHDLCERWEAAARPVAEEGVRLCIVRLGPVLEKHGGMLKQMLPAYKMGVGGKLGSGEQIISWVHLVDVVKGIRFLLTNTMAKGVYNLTAPNPVSNTHFTKALGRAIKRPTAIPMPGAALKALFGEMGDRLLLHGQFVIPLRINREGYIFDYETIEEAMEHIFHKPSAS